MHGHLNIMVLISPTNLPIFHVVLSGYLVKCLINARGIYLIVGAQTRTKQQ